MKFKVWSQILSESTPGPRSFHSCSLYKDRGDKMLIFGGLYQKFVEEQDKMEEVDFSNSEEEIYYNDLVAFDLDHTNEYFQELNNCLKRVYFDDLLINFNKNI